jgi:hypothetical protein
MSEERTASAGADKQETNDQERLGAIKAFWVVHGNLSGGATDLGNTRLVVV